MSETTCGGFFGTDAYGNGMEKIIKKKPTSTSRIRQRCPCPTPIESRRLRFVDRHVHICDSGEQIKGRPRRSRRTASMRPAAAVSPLSPFETLTPENSFDLSRSRGLGGVATVRGKSHRLPSPAVFVVNSTARRPASAAGHGNLAADEGPALDRD